MFARILSNHTFASEVDIFQFGNSEAQWKRIGVWEFHVHFKKLINIDHSIHYEKLENNTLSKTPMSFTQRILHIKALGRDY